MTRLNPAPDIGKEPAAIYAPRRILRSFSFLAGGRITGDGLAFLLIIVLAHLYGQDGVGTYSFAIGLTGFFSIFSDFGLYSYSIKELGRKGDEFKTLFGRMLALRLALSVLVIGALIAIVPLLPLSNEARVVVVLVGLWQVLQRLAEGISGAFVAHEDSEWAGALQASVRGVGAIAAVLVAVIGGGLVLAVAMLPLLGSLQLVWGFWLMVRRYGMPRLRGSLASMRELIREVWPFAGTGILSQIYARTDIVLIGLILGTDEAGVYNVAYRIIFLLMFIPVFASHALMPQAARMFAESKEELTKLFHKYINFIILVAVPLVAVVWLAAPDLILLLFGDDFDDSGAILRILTGVIFFGFLNVTLWTFLTAADRQGEAVRLEAASSVANIAGNAMLIPLIGLEGAAIATVASQGMLASLYVLKLRSLLGFPNVSSRVVTALAGVAAFLVPFLLLPDVPLAAMVPAALALYVATLLAMKSTRTGEVRMVMELLRKPADKRAERA